MYKIASFPTKQKTHQGQGDTEDKRLKVDYQILTNTSLQKALTAEK